MTDEEYQAWLTGQQAGYAADNAAANEAAGIAPPTDPLPMPDAAPPSGGVGGGGYTPAPPPAADYEPYAAPDGGSYTPAYDQTYDHNDDYDPAAVPVPVTTEPVVGYPGGWKPPPPGQSGPTEFDMPYTYETYEDGSGGWAGPPPPPQPAEWRPGAYEMYNPDRPTHYAEANTGSYPIERPAGDASITQMLGGVAYPVVQAYTPQDERIEAEARIPSSQQAWHNGIDVGTPVGTNLYMPADQGGRVTNVYDEDIQSATDTSGNPNNYNSLWIELDDGQQMVAAHLNDMYGAPDTVFEPGQLIGTTGSVSHRDAPAGSPGHLHLSIENADHTNSYDPVAYFGDEDIYANAHRRGARGGDPAIAARELTTFNPGQWDNRMSPVPDLPATGPTDPFDFLPPAYVPHSRR